MLNNLVPPPYRETGMKEKPQSRGTSFLIAVGTPGRDPRHFQWRNVWRSKSPWPRSLAALQILLLEIAKEKNLALPGRFGLTRTHGRRERRGFQGSLICIADERDLKVVKTFSGVRGIPGSHRWGEVEWKKQMAFPPIHFYGPEADPLNSHYAPVENPVLRA